MQNDTKEEMELRMKCLEKVRRRLVIDVNELANLISFEAEDLPRADTMSRAMVMRLLNVKNDYKFAQICMRAGLPYSAGTRYTKQQYTQLARMDEVMDMMFGLPDDKLSRLKQIIRDVYKGEE